MKFWNGNWSLAQHVKCPNCFTNQWNHSTLIEISWHCIVQPFVSSAASLLMKSHHCWVFWPLKFSVTNTITKYEYQWRIRITNTQAFREPSSWRWPFLSRDSWVSATRYCYLQHKGSYSIVCMSATRYCYLRHKGSCSLHVCYPLLLPPTQR